LINEHGYTKVVEMTQFMAALLMVALLDQLCYAVIKDKEFKTG